MIDLSQEQEQQIRKSGPIPAGSSVFVRLTVRKPKYEAPDMDFVGETQRGLLFLDTEYEVVSGQYSGLKIWENLFLPKGQQRTELSQGQTQACEIAGRKLRAVLESARGVDPKDTSPQADRKRQISSWLDLSGLEFPITVGIAKEQSQGRDGRMYWNNTVAHIVTVKMPQYDAVMGGGEVITNGPVTGDGKRQNGGSQEDPGYQQPPTSAYDGEVPF